MVVLQDNINDKNMPDHILMLNRIDIKNILNLPLKATQRIKYTCFEVSQNFIIFGASSGGLYVFRRQPCEFIQLLPNKTVPSGQLCQTIEELHKTMECVFLNKLQNLVRDTLLERIEAPPLDLSPSPGIGHLLNILRQVLSVAAVTEDKQEDTSMIVSCVLEPLLQAINLSASRLTPLDMAVYHLNCLYDIHETLRQYQYVEDKLEKLQAQMAVQIEIVSSEQANYLVTHLNLEEIQTILQGHGANIPLSQIQGMEAENLINFLSKLESMLVMPHTVAVPQIGCLKNPIHLSKVRRQSNEVISAVYKQLYEHVHNPTNEYDNPSALMSRTPDLVYQLLVNDENPS